MTHSIDYYFVPQSPWAYMGHARFVRMAQEHGATVRVLPMDLGQIFPVSGGLPLGKRAPQRQAYRLLELARFRDALGLPLHVQPQFFPVVGDAASRLIIAVGQQSGTAAALDITGRILAAVWAEQRDIANLLTLAELLAEAGLPAACLAQSNDAEVQALYARNTQAAIDRGIFGAPSFVVDGELFLGQDRLDFVERKLKS